MIILPIKEEFERALYSVSEIVSLLETHKYTFIDEVRAFIGSLEKRAEKYHLPFASEIGIIRGKMCVIDEALDFPSGSSYHPETRRIQRRNREAYALKRLDDACQLVRSYCTSSQASFTEAQNLCRQIAAVAAVKQLIQTEVTEENAATEQSAQAHEASVCALWHTITSDSDLCSLCTHVIGLIGYHNTIILFDRALGETGVPEKK